MNQKLFLTFSLFFCASFFLHAQTYKFLPKWKIGEHKTVTIIGSEVEYEDGELIGEAQDTSMTEIKVVGENENEFILETSHENEGIQAMLSMYEEFENELSEYKQTPLQYAVNKKTGEFGLVNWEEVHSKVMRSLSVFDSLVAESEDGMAGFANMIVGPIKKIYESKETFEASATKHIEFLSIPYSHTFKMGEPIAVTEKTANPMNPMMDSVSATTTLMLEAIDEKKRTANISQSIQFDMSSFMQMMKDMMREMAASFGGSEEDIEEKLKELDDMEFDMKNKLTLQYDFESTWPKRYDAEAIINGKEKGVVHKKIVRSVAIVN